MKSLVDTLGFRTGETVEGFRGEEKGAEEGGTRKRCLTMAQLATTCRKIEVERVPNHLATKGAGGGR